MPPLKPKQLMPAPAPTAPTTTVSDAASTAMKASVAVTNMAWISDR